jgi:hypothetical protein
MSQPVGVGNDDGTVTTTGTGTTSDSGQRPAMIGRFRPHTVITWTGHL